MSRLNSALLRRAIAAAAKAAAVQHDLTDAFRERYGVTYSDVDCDVLIDALDYGAGGQLTVADCDRLMAECGVTPHQHGAGNGEKHGG